MSNEISAQQLSDEIISNPLPATAQPWQLALRDISDGLRNWRIWVLLGWQDIRLRYRRSSLGPFWLTISMGITIYAMGFLYGHLFRINLQDYYPFLAAGMLTWNLLNAIVNDETYAFIEAENYIKQMKIPYTIFPLRVMWRNLIVFAHNIIVIIPIIIFFHIKITPAFLMLIPGLIIIALSGYFYGVILAMFAARYRDVSQIIMSFMQVVFFLTPIMWQRTILPPQYQYVTEFNPFAQYIELLRAPLTGHMPGAFPLISTVVLTFFGMLMAFYLFCRARSRIVYWL